MNSFASRKTWFQKEFGFEEANTASSTDTMDTVRSHMIYDDKAFTLHSKVNQKTWYVGKFSLPSVEELHEQISALKSEILNLWPPNEVDELAANYPFFSSSFSSSSTSSSSSNTLLEVSNIIGDTTALHLDKANKNSIFQCASQFNCLEMANPWIVPEEGITCYEYDMTQGPLSAMCCPYGTFVRNYYGVDGVGQSTERQINTVTDIEISIENDKYNYWKVQNGYLLSTRENSIKEINERLDNSEGLRTLCHNKLRVGVQWDTQTRIPADGNGETYNVCQVYSSAVPISYDRIAKKEDWSTLCPLVLNATYEATLAIGAIKILEKLLQYARRKQEAHGIDDGDNINCNSIEDLEINKLKIYLTKVGGGVFGNPDNYIARAIQNAVNKFRYYPLTINIVHYKSLPGQPYSSIKPI